jgi:flagellar basal-body rod protein FlgB
MADAAQMNVFALMKARLGMLSERQKVIAENVANVSTPGYVPRDIDRAAFAATLGRMARPGSGGAGQVALTRTQPGHMAPGGGSGAAYSVRKSPDSETTLDGNAVVVEEQMMKIAETRTDFETMVGLYQKSVGLLKLAVRSPSR